MNPPVGVEHSPLAVAVIVRWGIACLIASTSVGSVPSGNGTTMLPSKMVSMPCVPILSEAICFFKLV